ncbi:MAG TPA: SDR family oxidoreductase, partial [Candidatus Synoicihabitans sp.]|nr:SDR family oxidoreductase [Candidatus Synoicihabitans sp.]
VRRPGPIRICRWPATRQLERMANVLFIGGTGIISTACTELAVARGFEVTLLNRSGRALVAGTKTIAADVGDVAATAAALRGRTWDCVVDFLAFTPAHIDDRLRLFLGHTGQYVFISSASAYQKPLRGHPLITESTPLANPLWDYSRNKIACEERLLGEFRANEFPVTIVRPSLTYGDIVVPLAVNSWQRSFTAIDRLRRGRPLIIPGDGLTLWTITHNSDFAKGLVGLLGHRGSIGHAFHITSEEALTWNEIYAATAEAAGVNTPRFVHIASDFITTCLPESVGSLLGDKSHTALFDNTKIKRFVPDYVATTRYRDGIARTIAWFEAEPARQQVDRELDEKWDRVIAAYENGLDAARRLFAT